MTHARYQEEEFDQNLASLLIFFTKLGVREVYSVLYVKPMIIDFSIVCSKYNNFSVGGAPKTRWLEAF